MERWIKIGVVAQIICMFLAGWGTYRMENPLPPSPNATHENQKSAPDTKTRYMSAVWYGPIASGALLVISVCLFVFAKPRSAERTASKLAIHLALWGVGGAWWQRWWKYKNVTDIVRAKIKNNAIDIAASNELFSDPFIGDHKHLLIRYSLNGQTAEDVVSEGRYFTVPDKATDDLKDIDDSIFRLVQNSYPLTQNPKTRQPVS